MTDKKEGSKNSFSADWLLRGALTRIGDTFDRFTGRKWIPSSSLATSELIERMKRLLDSEAKEVPGKGFVVPHNIKLKMQWDKFSTDSESTLRVLETELLAAAADHINDSLYYTFAPLNVEVKPDYFTEGVKLYVGFDDFADEEPEAELNITMAGVQPGGRSASPESDMTAEVPTFIVRYTHKGYPREKRLEFPAGRRVTIGRTAGNDLILDDVSVSKIHAALVLDPEGSLSVADTGSTNGTFINDERIAYGKASRLHLEDRVKFGSVEVKFERPRPAIPDPGAAVPEIKGGVETVAIGGFDFTTRRSDAIQPEMREPAEIAMSENNVLDDAGCSDTEPNIRSGLTTSDLDTKAADE